MAAEHHPADSRRIPSLVEKFRNKRYRHSYVASHTRRFLARQMRRFRGEKSQSEFGILLGKQQTVVSRLEDASYGKWTLQTLFDVAQKLDVAVIVRFVDHKTFLRFTENMADDATAPSAYSQDAIEKMLEPEISQSMIDRINREQSFVVQPLSGRVNRGQSFVIQPFSEQASLPPISLQPRGLLQ
jgi:hypothetical protein